MSDITRKAKENYMNGLSCGEAVVKTAIDAGIIRPSNEVLKISSALKAGIGQKRDVCGALMGAVLVLGIKHGRINKDEYIDTVN
ncbi:C_GCAxxG_C_C family protein [Candidatus Parcubacteria bacterium]|nr:C_GCAxxG_C_C family protein [Candidatus Parcubacteria bacterium]